MKRPLGYCFVGWIFGESMSYLLGVRRAIFIASILALFSSFIVILLCFNRSIRLLDYSIFSIFLSNKKKIYQRIYFQDEIESTRKFDVKKCASRQKREISNARGTSFLQIQDVKKCKKIFYAFFLVWSFTLIASLRFQSEMSLSSFYEEIEGKTSLILNGKIVEQKKTTSGISLILDDIFILKDEKKEKLSKKVIVYGAVCEYLMGQRIEVLGEFSLQKEPTNPGEFNSYIYYRAKGIYGSLFCKQVKRVYGVYNPIWELARRIRVNLEKIYEKLFSEEEMGVVAAMLLGEKSELSEEIKILYQENGISHILAISGLHISFFGRNLYRQLRKCHLSFFSSAFFSASFLLFYGCIVGSSHSAFRAIVMLFMTFLADIIGRSYDLVSTVYFTAILILIREPFCLFDSGFLLSFGAVFGIGLISPILQKIFGGEKENEIEEKEQFYYKRKGGFSWRNIERWCKSKFGEKWNKRRKRKRKKRERFQQILREKIENLSGSKYILVRKLTEGLKRWEKREPLRQRIKKSLKESLLMSISIQLVTIPILLRFYYELPTYGILLNLMILPLLSFLLPLAVAAGMMGSIRLSIGKVFALGVSFLLQIYKNSAKFCLELPFHKWTVGNLGEGETILYMVGAASILFFLYSRVSIEKMRFLSKILLCLYMIVLGSSMLISTMQKHSEMRIIMLDVGQGDGILMELSDGTKCMIDGGSSSKDKVGNYILLPALKYYGMGYLDYAFVSHEDRDHISGLMELLERDYPIKNLVLPYREDEEKEKNYVVLLELAREKKTNLIFFKQGDSMKKKNFVLSCFHPKKQNQEGDPNADSMVLSLQYYNFRALFTGDLSDGGETALVEELKRREESPYTFLKVAHHGSKKSTFEPLLELVRPKISLISCSASNRYGHPGAETLERLGKIRSDVLITKDVGAIELRISKMGRIWRKVFYHYEKGMRE